jgi:alkaline phosphatase D
MMDRGDDIRCSRRSFVLGSLALCSLHTAPLRAAAILGQTPKLPSPLFTLGVASGDPTPDGVVLWTRLAPDPLGGGGMPPLAVDVWWEIANDDRFSSIARQGRTAALPEWAHSVHVEASGLEPDRWYWYRFRVGDERSPVGRTRTLPRAAAPAGRLRFAFASCQQFEMGHYTAYRHMAAEDLHVVFHLGDYIYEGGGTAGRVRLHSGPEITTLADYRNRHAQYKTDPDLQAAHAAFPFIVTWDDHEVDNDYAGLLQEHGHPVEVFERRRAAGYQAYYEHMPLRASSLPKGAWLQLYRRFSYGTLASFFVLDTRQFRTDQPCAGEPSPCRAVFDEKATLLGPEQERWLFDGFAQSRTRWNLLPQQVMVAPVDRAAGPDQRISTDQWGAYDVARIRLLQALAGRRAANPVVLTGDIHSNWVNDLKVDFADPRSPVVATEFVGTSITSGGDGQDAPPTLSTLLSENPFVKFHNQQRGYVTCELTPKSMRADYRVVDYVSKPGAPVRTRARFVVEDGRPGALRA